MKQLAFILLMFVFSLTQSFAQSKGIANTENGLALEGYDPVAYFAGKPAKGVAGKSVVFQGITYRFSSTENIEQFKKNPSMYVPQYGGWCAYAMGSTGEKVEVDPETYKVIGGKLYLFYNKYLNNTLKSWNKNEAALKIKADANWQKLNR